MGRFIILTRYTPLVRTAFLAGKSIFHIWYGIDLTITQQTLDTEFHLHIKTTYVYEIV